jgi:hypothetical protein
LSRHGHHFALSHGNVAMPRFGCHVEVRPVKPGKTKIPSPSAFACPPPYAIFCSRISRRSRI